MCRSDCGSRVEQLVALQFDTGPLTSVAFDPAANRLIVHVRTENARRLRHLDRLRAHLAEMGLDW